MNRAYNLDHSASIPNSYLQASFGSAIVLHQGLLSFIGSRFAFADTLAQRLATAYC
ncbi:hypothetical protein HMPREF3226_01927 [Prevotella corporis]|uniref:Uncharacterized protein n=1 Tax=Prevotella corporis TaxID=28128 RepID=A0A133PZE6_9BACT|nr:hypothetical protein HMPREF3226_01927 [Prevotella corporis]